MKKFLMTVLILSTAVATPVIAEEMQHKHGAEQSGGMMSPGPDMEAHRQAMQEMRDLMQRAKAATDPAERKRLMAEHREKMQAHMAHMMGGGNAKMMQQHHERMAMMHEMMAQMAAHHAAEQGAQPNE